MTHCASAARRPPPSRPPLFYPRHTPLPPGPFACRTRHCRSAAGHPHRPTLRCLPLPPPGLLPPRCVASPRPPPSVPTHAVLPPPALFSLRVGRRPAACSLFSGRGPVPSPSSLLPRTSPLLPLLFSPTPASRNPTPVSSPSVPSLYPLGSLPLPSPCQGIYVPGQVNPPCRVLAQAQSVPAWPVYSVVVLCLGSANNSVPRADRHSPSDYL